jgi:hypothetical protein
VEQASRFTLSPDGKSSMYAETLWFENVMTDNIRNNIKYILLHITLQSFKLSQPM